MSPLKRREEGDRSERYGRDGRRRRRTGNCGSPVQPDRRRRDRHGRQDTRVGDRPVSHYPDEFLFHGRKKYGGGTG